MDSIGHWTEEEWSQVLFTDESLIKQFSSNRPAFRRPKGQRYNPRYTVSSVRNCPSIMIWGAISCRGRGPIWFAPKNSTINGQIYLFVLQESFIPGCLCPAAEQESLLIGVKITILIFWKTGAANLPT